MNKQQIHLLKVKNLKKYLISVKFLHITRLSVKFHLRELWGNIMIHIYPSLKLFKILAQLNNLRINF